MRFMAFAAIFITVMAAMNLYSYHRFLKRLNSPINRYAVFLPIILMIGDVFFVLEIVFPVIPESPALYIVTSSFIGVTFMLFVIAVTYDLSITASSRVPFDRERRKAIKIIFDVTMLVAAISYLLRGLAQGLKDPSINNVIVNIKKFPENGYSIVQLSDVHVGRTIRRDYVEMLVRRTNELMPDLVVITGDLVDLPIKKIKKDLEPLANINAPTYFILGNHEYFHGAVESIEFLGKLGIKSLLNESVVIGKGEKRFNLIGVTDVVGDRMNHLKPDLEMAYKTADTQYPCIVLAHQPRFIDRMDQYRCDLMLSGHTHGGQIFPFGFLVMLAQPYLAGLYQHDDEKQIFVSRGTGYWGPPLRILAPSEISHIVIRDV